MFAIVNGGATSVVDDNITINIATYGYSGDPLVKITYGFTGVGLGKTIAFKEFIPNVKLPEGLEHEDTVTLYIRITDDNNVNTDLTVEFEYLVGEDRYSPYTQDTQIIANNYPDHSPIRNRKDSVGHKILNILSEQAAITFRMAEIAGSSNNLNNEPEWVPDVLSVVDIPPHLATVQTSSNICLNGDFRIQTNKYNSEFNIQDWVMQGINTNYVSASDYLVESEGGSLGQVRYVRKQCNDVTLNVCYKPIGADLDGTSSICHLWLLLENGDTIYTANTISGIEDSINILQLGSPVYSPVVGYATYLELDENMEIKYVTIRVDDSRNKNWSPSDSDFPFYFNSKVQVPFHVKGCIPAADSDDFFFRAVPTGAQVLEIKYPHKDGTPSGLMNEHEVFTSAAGQTQFTLNLPPTVPEIALVIYNGVALQHGIHYTINGNYIDWIFPVLEEDDIIGVHYGVDTKDNFTGLKSAGTVVDRFRDTHAVGIQINETSIVKSYVETGDILATYNKLGFYKAGKFVPEDMSSIGAACTNEGGTLLFILQAGEGVLIHVCDFVTPYPEPDTLQVLTTLRIEEGFGNVTDMYFLNDSDMMHLIIETEYSLRPVRLNYDYMTFASSDLKAYFREDKGNICIEPVATIRT